MTNMLRPRTPFSVALVGALLLSLAACGSNQPSSSPGASAESPGPSASATAPVSPSSSMVVNMAVAPGTLDPAVACNFTDLTVIQNVYSTLTQFGTKPGPSGTTEFDPSVAEPYLAESWTLSPDKTIYTFQLRSGLHFASGNPVDAAAVKYSMERAITMASCGFAGVEDLHFDPLLVKSIDVVDATHVKFTLSQPDPQYLLMLAGPFGGIVDPSVVEANGGVVAGTVNQYMAGHAAGFGPFNLSSYEAGNQAVLEANPDFFEQPAVKKITINFITSDATLLLQARSGAADVTIGLTKQSVHSLEGNSEVRIIATPTAISEQIGLLNTAPPTDNAKFREALSYAVPYDEILTNVAFGYGKLYYGPIPPGITGYNPTLEAPRSLDLPKANQLIADSNLATPIALEMDIIAGNAQDQQIATIVQSTWKQIGVNLTIKNLSPTDYLTALEQHQMQSWIRLDGPFLIDPGFYLSYDMKCDFMQNNSAACIPEADKLVVEARKALDPSTVQPMWDEVINLWSAQSPKIPVYDDSFAAVLNKRVTSYYYSNSLDFRTWSN
jgi:peptide/nickel transport system substrate-binding protein